MKLEVDVWEMKEGEITAVKHGDMVFFIASKPIDIEPVMDKAKEFAKDIDAFVSKHRPNIKRKKGLGRPPAIAEWLEDKPVGYLFHLKDFYICHRGCSRASRIHATNQGISMLISKGIIIQMTNDSFKKVK